MAIEVKIPQISEGVDSAQVIEILVSEGDSIKKDQSVIAVETEKASVEVPSSDSGKVKEIKVKEGQEVKVGDVILILEEEEGEDKEGEEKKENGKEDKGAGEEKKVAEEKDRTRKGDKKEDEEEEKEEKEVEEEKKIEKDKDKKEKGDKEERAEEKEEAEKAPKEEGDEQGTEDIPASPSVRRLAREIGVEIKSIAGSGPGGRITEEDVKSQAKKKGDKEEVKQPSLPDFTKWGKVEKEKLSNIRKSTAKNTTASWQSIPHVFQFDEADISGIEEYMKKNSEIAEEAGGKLTITAILVKITANALQQFPKFNASIDMQNEEVILKKYVHIGIAVDTDKGLLVPVIRDVDKKTIIELAVEITGLAEKAREQKLTPEEMQGGNFSISNLGGIGGTNFTPIVYHPQVAILGISRAKIQPVFTDGKFEPRQKLPLSLSYDHRLIDGAEGAKFLHWICQALEDPYRALLGA